MQDQVSVASLPSSYHLLGADYPPLYQPQMASIRDPNLMDPGVTFITPTNVTNTNSVSPFPSTLASLKFCIPLHM